MECVKVTNNNNNNKKQQCGCYTQKSQPYMKKNLEKNTKEHEITTTTINISCHSLLLYIGT